MSNENTIDLLATCEVAGKMVTNGFVMERGIAEITRVQDSAKKTQAKNKLFKELEARCRATGKSMADVIAEMVV